MRVMGLVCWLARMRWVRSSLCGSLGRMRWIGRMCRRLRVTKMRC